MIRVQATAETLFPLFFVALVGLGFLAGGALAFRYQNRIVSEWPQVNAEVTRSYLHQAASRNGTLYRAEWEFRYTAGGREYQVPVQSNTRSTSYQSRKREADEFPAGSHHLIRYDPSNPGHIEIRAAYSFRFFLLPLLFLAVGVVVTLVSGWLLIATRNRGAPLECESCRQPLERTYKFCPRCAAQIPLRERVSRGPKSRYASGGPRAGWIVGGVFTAIGLAALGFGAWAAARNFTVIRSWPEVDAQVTKSSIVRSRSTNGDFRYVLLAEFRYSTGGGEITSQASTSGLNSNIYSSALRNADLYSAGTRHRIRVNPANPKDIRFGAGYTLDFFGVPLALGALGLIFTVLGLVVLLVHTRKPRLCGACHMPVAKTHLYCPYCAAAQGVAPLEPA